MTEYPSTAHLHRWLEIALTVTAEAASVAAQATLDATSVAADAKSSRNDLVTMTDRAIEDMVVHHLRERTALPTLGEEGHTVDSFEGLVWVLDPIDGTMNFVETHRDFAVSLALCCDGTPVLGVVQDVMGGHTYTAIRGEGATCDGKSLPPLGEGAGRRESVLITDLKEIQALPRLAQCLIESRGHRRYGSAALECVEVATGRAGAFVHLWVSPWDIAASSVICQETGARFTRLDGTPLDVRFKGSVLVAPPRTHAELLQRLVIDPE
ncbi:inositol monophosphatase family protein [Actinomyces radicidentis]|uniref:inositol monophosphatase family protein n=1 Tax=Actinomyces radicidentis TaxID=111015 RepID=UPI0026E0DE86|nr:inositol monophosphatase [Actinomyces radicidentis]